MPITNIVDMGGKAKEDDVYVFDLEKLKRVTPEVKELVEKNFPKEFYGDDILIYEAWSLRSILEVMCQIAVEQSKKPCCTYTKPPFKKCPKCGGRDSY